MHRSIRLLFNIVPDTKAFSNHGEHESKFPYFNYALGVMLHNLDVGNEINDSGQETDGYTSNLIDQSLVENLRIESST
ncbi:hypothetical protein B9Z55_014779 [Caenorhabditis nigoni]|nr:hypothetical protein B9Z55_014779 [Caenorhabditis nigoni]